MPQVEENNITGEKNPLSNLPPSPSPQRVGSWHEIGPALDQWQEFFNALPKWSYVEQQYDMIIEEGKRSGRLRQVMVELCMRDRYFLLTRVLRRPDARGQIIYQLTRMVEADPDGNLDLWAREHYKTSIITFAGTIQEVLKNPEITISIFSFTKPIAKSFLMQIKREFEGNELLKKLFPHILYSDPRKQSRKLGFSWSADYGITVKRGGNTKEATVEAWGLTDGQPTSKHFDLRIYNDIVTRDTVRTAASIRNTTDGWELSLNLGADQQREWYEGTIYDNADTYSVLRDRGAVKIRLIPATYNGEEDGPPLLKSREEIKAKRRAMGQYNFSCQWMLRPEKAGAMGFDINWLRYWPAEQWRGMNIYIIVDPAGSKKEAADYTTMVAIGIGPDRKKYLIDGVRDKLNLGERTNRLFELVFKFDPLVVYYERYGLQSDVEHIEEKMGERNYRFDIQEVGGSMAKVDRINRLQPDFENGVWFIPQTLYKRNHTGERYDVIYEFIHKEYLEWPFPTHDDFLDALSRIYDIPIFVPDRNTIQTKWEIAKEDIYAEEAWEPLKMERKW